MRFVAIKCDGCALLLQLHNHTRELEDVDWAGELQKLYSREAWQEHDGKDYCRRCIIEKEHIL